MRLLPDNKVSQARNLLSRLGFDRERSNDRSSLVLLALLKLRPQDPWSAADNPLLGTRAIMDWVAQAYGVVYAPNTRETIRRFTLHQFIDAMLVEQNPDNPDRPINSPKWSYRVYPAALKVIRLADGPDLDAALESYLQEAPGLIAQYAAARSLRRIPITLPDGRAFSLSPGGQNLLIRQMIDDFCAYHTPGGHVLYVGDADAKWAVFESETLSSLGVTIDRHGKMPDLVVYWPEKNWLILLEAASTHGPVDSKRRRELSELFAGSTAGLVFVSCFHTRAEMRRYSAEIAWETEAWCADHPTHMIHFNGSRFLGPYEPGS